MKDQQPYEIPLRLTKRIMINGRHIEPGTFHRIYLDDKKGTMQLRRLDGKTATYKDKLDSVLIELTLVTEGFKSRFDPTTTSLKEFDTNKQVNGEDFSGWDIISEEKDKKVE